MSTITELVKELANQPITEDTETLFSERTITLVHRIAEKCESTHSPVDEYIWKRRADDLLIYLVRECSGCKPELYIEMLARLLVPVINNKLEWEEESEQLMATHQQGDHTLVLETDPEDTDVFAAKDAEPALMQTAREFFSGLRAG